MTVFTNLAAMCLVASLAGPYPAAAQSNGTTDWLVVVQGQVAAASNDTLTIAVPSPAIAFTDRPARLVRLIDLERFLSTAWADDSDLRATPPNASLIDETNGEIAVIEISDMELSDGALSVTYTLLEGSAPPAGNRIALTIDAFPTTVNDQMTDIVAPN